MATQHSAPRPPTPQESERLRAESARLRLKSDELRQRLHDLIAIFRTIEDYIFKIGREFRSLSRDAGVQEGLPHPSGRPIAGSAGRQEAQPDS